MLITDDTLVNIPCFGLLTNV